MSDDFKVGDVVVCVDALPCIDWVDVPGYIEAVRELRSGAYYRIADVQHWHLWAEGDGITLTLEGETDAPTDPDWPSMPSGWGSGRFRKLPPADEAFIRQMRAMKPAKVPA